MRCSPSAQGSVRPSRVSRHAVARRQVEARQAGRFVGKGVVFDTGGISIKPAAGMEDMKGDMGGAAASSALMHALAERKANVNAVGLIGSSRTCPSGTAHAPRRHRDLDVRPDDRDPQH